MAKVKSIPSANRPFQDYRSAHSHPSAGQRRARAAAHVVERLEARQLLAADFASTTFTDPFPVPGTRGQAVVTPVFHEAFQGRPAIEQTPGVIGSGWNPDGAAQFTATTPAALQGAKSAMSVEFWAKNSSVSLRGPGFSIGGQGNFGPNGTVWVNFFMAQDGKYVGKAAAHFPFKPDDSKWHHYVATFDGRYVSAYADGELINRIWITNSANQIGPMEDGTNAVLNPNLTLGPTGKVDELRIYNTALSPMDVRRTFENYRAYGTVRYVSPTGSGTGTGLDTNNPMSLTGALALVGPDVKLILKGGFTYNGADFQLTNKGGTSPDHAALIMGETGSSPAIIRVSSGSVGPTITGGGYLTLRNLRFTNASASTTHAMKLTSVVNPLLLDAVDISSDTAGLLVTGSTKVTVQNTVVQVATTGMSFVTSPNAIVRNNTIRNGTVGLSFSSTSNYNNFVQNLITGQTSKALSIDAGSFTNVIADDNVYGPAAGGLVATLGTTDYATTAMEAYRVRYLTLNDNPSRSSERHSFVTSPTYQNTSTTSLDLRLQAIAGNPIDTGTASTLSDFGSSMTIDPALWDATGASRPLPHPLDQATTTGGNAADPGAFETAGPITFQFTLPAARTVSAAVYDAAGKMVRTLYSGRKLAAGTNTAYWNGLDDNNQPVAAANYTIKALANNVSYVWEGAIGNSSANPTGPTTLRPFFSMPSSMVADPTGTTLFMAMGYQEAFDHMYRMNVSAPTQVVKKFGFEEGIHSRVMTDVATDGTRSYFVSSMGVRTGTPAARFVVAYNYSDDSMVTGGNWAPIDGGPYSGIKVGNAGPQGVISIQGVAVQYNAGGNLLFVSVKGDNKVYLYDKTTGAKQATEISVTSPGDIAVSATGDLWVVSGTTVKRFSASNGWASAVQTISGLQGAVAITWTPFTYGQTGSGGTLLLADGGTSQQVKAFRNDTGASVWTHGQAGGYANGITVTTDKFQFGTWSHDEQYGYTPATYLTALPDGTFWAHDQATQRMLQFNSSRVNQPAGTIAMLASFYAASADVNNPTRVFGGFVEYAIDYSKPVAGGNGSWTPVKYYGFDIPEPDAYGFEEGIVNAITLSNGRTYATTRNHFIELTSTGARLLGFDMNHINGEVTGVPWRMQADGSLTTLMPDSPNATLRKRALLGFDASNNPIWGPSTIAATIANPGGMMKTDPLYVEWKPDPVTGSLLTYEPSRAGGYHIGAISPTTNDWVWKAARSERLDGRGAWDSSGQHAGGQDIAGVVDGSMFVTYRGEFWQGVQANQLMQFSTDGLFIGQWGVPLLVGADQYTSAVPGQSSNMMNVRVVKAANGNYYLYANDESGHGGIARYRIDGMNTLQTYSGTVNLSGTTIPNPPSGPTATTVSTSQINVTWVDNSNNETGFKIDRATNNSFTANLTTVTVGANVTSLNSTGLNSNTAYYYRVRSTNAAGDSGNSTTASATTLSNSIPAAPSELTATANSISGITINWTDNANNETGFAIDRATNSSFTQDLVSGTVGANVTTYASTTLAPGRTYYYRVRATNASGSSGNSNTASATTTASIVPSGLMPSGVYLVAREAFSSGYTFANPVPSEDNLNGQGASVGVGWAGAWSATNFKIANGDPYNGTHNYTTTQDGFQVVPGGSGFPYILRGGFSSNGSAGNADRTLATPITKPSSGTREFWLAGTMTQFGYSGTTAFLVLQDASGNPLAKVGVSGTGTATLTGYTATAVAVNATAVSGVDHWDSYVLRGVWSSNGDVTLSFWLNANVSDTLGTADATLSTASNNIKINAASIAKVRVDVPGAVNNGFAMIDDLAVYTTATAGGGLVLLSAPNQAIPRYHGSSEGARKSVIGTRLGTAGHIKALMSNRTFEAATFSRKAIESLATTLMGRRTGLADDEIVTNTWGADHADKRDRLSVGRLIDDCFAERDSGR